MTDCLFCKIASGEIPAKTVYSDDHVFAFQDIAPKAPTHVLVIPRKHIANAAELRHPDDATDLSGVFALAQEVVRLEDLEERGHRLVFNVGRESGNTVPHLHLHVLGGRSMGWPPG